MKEFFLRHLKLFLIIVGLLVTILIGILTGIILVYQKGFPDQIKNLEDIKPIVTTVIYDDMSNPIKEYAIENRKIIRSSDIPDFLKKAIVIAEDKQFYEHWGINFKGVMRAISGIIMHKKRGGGSSITQQLARNLFLTREISIKRKLKEMLLSIQIERNYTKDQIITFYCNQIFLGANVYGVESAANYYFGKKAKDLSLAEAATIAAIIPNPNGIYNVFRRPKRVLQRRNYILKNMLKSGYITEEQYKEAIKEELPDTPHFKKKESLGDYFLEEVRKYMEYKYGDKLLYQDGLKVYTTLNQEMQKWAEESLKKGLRNLDKRRGWRFKKKRSNLLKESKDIRTYQLKDWKNIEIKENGIYKGIVLSVNKRVAKVRISDYMGILRNKNAEWTKYNIRRLFKRGDVILVKVLKKNDKKKTLDLYLEQEPEVQGAIIVVDNKTGKIKAMVGGYDFNKSKWNNATQALRQTGSTFKPIIYTAALENGYTPATLINDEETVFDNQWTKEPWIPQNHTKDHKGPLTLRRALEQSRNIVTAKIVEQITPPKVVEYAKKFGITARLQPYMSIALGTFEVTLKEMVAAYTVFPNYGIRVNPYFVEKIRNRNNNILEETYPDRKMVVEPDVAFVMNYLLQGVVKYGTGWRARKLNCIIGGKTGTTDDYTDAWFIGYSPTYTVGVWVGFDIKKNLGHEETGSRAASPIFVSFFKKLLEKYSDNKKYRKPSGVVMVKIDKYTGKLLTPDCLYPFNEYFLSGTEPTERCNEEYHREILDYYDMQTDEEN